MQHLQVAKLLLLRLGKELLSTHKKIMYLLDVTEPLRCYLRQLAFDLYSTKSNLYTLTDATVEKGLGAYARLIYEANGVQINLSPRVAVKLLVLTLSLTRTDIADFAI